MTASLQSSLTEAVERKPLVRRRLRVLGSLLLVCHLLAVFLPPLAFQANGPLGLSPAVETALAPFQSYSEFTYLNRGYAFFAPDPGPSHLIQAGLTDDAGNLTEQLFPDLERQWPRLLYHRHFMLAEFLNQSHQPPGPPTELAQEDPEGAQAWADARAQYERVRQSIAQHLEQENPGQRVAIRRLEHLIPDVIEFQRQPIELTDKRLYQVLLDDPFVPQRDGNLVAPDRPPEAVPTPDGTTATDQQRQRPDPTDDETKASARSVTESETEAAREVDRQPNSDPSAASDTFDPAGTSEKPIPSQESSQSKPSESAGETES